jgi:hypothetical protein
MALEEFTGDIVPSRGLPVPFPAILSIETIPGDPSSASGDRPSDPQDRQQSLPASLNTRMYSKAIFVKHPFLTLCRRSLYIKKLPRTEMLKGG